MIVVIFIGIVIILFNNFETQTITENKKTVEEKPNNGLISTTKLFKLLTIMVNRPQM